MDHDSITRDHFQMSGGLIEPPETLEALGQIRSSYRQLSPSRQDNIYNASPVARREQDSRNPQFADPIQVFNDPDWHSSRPRKQHSPPDSPARRSSRTTPQHFPPVTCLRQHPSSKRPLRTRRGHRRRFHERQSSLEALLRYADFPGLPCPQTELQTPLLVSAANSLAEDEGNKDIDQTKSLDDLLQAREPVSDPRSAPFAASIPQCSC